MPNQAGVSLSYGHAGEGVVTGDYVMDRVCLGRGDAGELCTAMTFLAAKEMADAPWTMLPFDGVVGLGPGLDFSQAGVNGTLDATVARMSAQEVAAAKGDENAADPMKDAMRRRNAFTTLMRKGTFLNNRYAVWVASAEERAGGAQSEMTLGSFDKDRLASKMYWIPIDMNAAANKNLQRKELMAAKQRGVASWALRLDDIAITPGMETTTESHLQLQCPGGCTAIPDTSTFLLVASRRIVDHLRGALQIADDCSNYDRLPLLGFVLDEVVFNLAPRHYVDKNARGCFDRFSSVEEKDTVLLGMPFLEAYYTVFDRDSLSVGVALSNHKTSVVSEAPLGIVKTMVVPI